MSEVAMKTITPSSQWDDVEAVDKRAETEVVMYTESLSKHWGGLKALNELSISFHDRQLHGVVGPNGAGKSTLLNILCGTYKPTSGQIFYHGKNITGLRPYQFSHEGIGRGFQKTNIFNSMTCLENCCVAAQARIGGGFRFFNNRNNNTVLKEIAADALKKVGLAQRADITASKISYGEQRQLEIAMVLATKPSVLLLDEPMAGMGHEESQLIIDLLGRLKHEYCIVLVEHDMDAVFELSDQLTVMVDGTLLTTGTVDDIRNDPRVKAAYLGEGDEVF